MSKNEDFDLLLQVFEERAEYLPKDKLINWSVLTEKEDIIVSKLKGPGLKLLSGPRGSGKSTLLLRAFYELQEDMEYLPVYVNFSRSISLEPLGHNSSNASGIFRQWVIAKIILGIQKYFEDFRTPLFKFTEWDDTVSYYRNFISELEKGVPLDSLVGSLTIDEMLDKIHKLCQNFGFKRSVLLLDDAAHAFSADQQKEFFEIFASLRSSRISAKAAVYPGVTSYSPTFHVGHDAELINAWYSPDDVEYLDLMNKILVKRLPEYYLKLLTDKQEIVSLLALASFGIPRAFINMIGKIISFGDTGNPKFDRRSALIAVKEQADVSMKVFSSIKSRMTRYSNFIDVGEILLHNMTTRLNISNRTNNPKAVQIGINKSMPKNIDRAFEFLEYAGMIREGGEISRGGVGVFRRYTLHYAQIISNNALGLGANFSIADIVAALTNKVNSRYPLGMIGALLTTEQVLMCVLELPPCQVCGTTRIAEDQKFCMNCGNELNSPSLYREMLDANVDKLPITENKILKLKQSGQFNTVQDILIDDSQKLMSIRGIGRYWSKRIKTAAEEFVSV